jgi:hypothetical protein
MFSKSVRSFFFVVVINNTHRQMRKSPHTKTFKRISHFTQPHVYSLVVTHGRENAKHTVYRTLTVGPEKGNFYTVRGNALHVVVRKVSVMNGRFSVPTEVHVLMKLVEANVNKYVCTAERKYSCVFMDTTHEV